MKKMIISDFLQARSSMRSQLIMAIVIGIVCGFVTADLAAAFAAPCAAFACGHCIGMPYWDDANDWQTLRLAMPFSRRDIVVGRYMNGLLFMVCGVLCGVAAVLLTYLCMSLFGENLNSQALAAFGFGQFGTYLAVFLVMAACLLVMFSLHYALSFKYGMTKATRLLPIIALFLFIACFVLLDFFEDATIEASFDTFFSMSTFGILFVIALCVYAASMFFSLKAYEKREF